jgi:hypothetical protein
MNAVSEIPIASVIRAFSTDAVTGVALPDGIFDTALRSQFVNYFVSNSSAETIHDVEFNFDGIDTDLAGAVASVDITPENKYLQLPELGPGETQHIREGARQGQDRDHCASGGQSQGRLHLPPNLSGPGWHCYIEDGCGNYSNGDPFNGSGRGGTWPLPRRACCWQGPPK